MFKQSRFKPLMASAAILFFAHPSVSKAVDFKVDGFGSLYYGQAFSKDLLPYGFSSTNPDFTDFSLIGSDVSAKFNDEWSAAAEIIAEGQSGPQTNYTIFAEWAYLNWAPIDGLSIKVGRQREPIWTASEYINNHFELPYRVMPSVVYQLSPFASFDGASITQAVKLNDALKGSIQAFGGTPLLGTTVDPSVATFSGQRLIGARANVDGDGWRARVQASRTLETINWGSGLVPGQPFTYAQAFGAINTANVNTFTAGYRFDKYNFVSWGEYGYLYSNDGTIQPSGAKFLHTGKAGYVLAGYRLDKFLPRYTFAQSSVDEGIQTGRVTSHTVGVNYAANEHVILKAEVELNLVPTPGGGPAFVVTQPAGSSATSGSALYLGGDFYF